MPGNTKKGKHSSRKNPCPLCGNTTGSCKQNYDGSIYCYHSNSHSAPSGYVHIRELSGGMGQEFIEPRIVDELLIGATTLQSRGKKASASDMADLTGLPSSWAMAVQKAYPSKFPEWNNPLYRYHRSKTEEKVKHKPNELNEAFFHQQETLKENFPQASFRQVQSEEERDIQYRQILAQLQLIEVHHAHLKDVRGLGEFIDFIGLGSWQETQVENVSADLPGVVERDGSLYLYGQPGLFLPFYNEFGQLISFQLRPDNPSGGKYKWGSSAPVGGNGPRLQNGEMPLAFCRPPSVLLPSIGLAEGVLKAWSVACNLKQIIIGAPGAAWDCSPNLLKRYLEKVAQERNISVSALVIDLYADAGMLSNRHIMHRYYETIKLLQQWGCKTRIGWWGQFTKEDPDIDDLILQGGRHQITYISIDEWIALWSSELRYSLLHNDKQFDTSDWVAPVQHPDRSELGFWVKSGKGFDDTNSEWQWIPKTNFSFKIERELIGTNNAFGGVILQVKRTYDSISEQDRVVVPAEALHKVTDFINCIARSTGKVYLVNKLKPEELQKYLHKELAAYRERGGKPYKLCDRIGRQSDGTWVFPNCQISSDGRFITESESGWVFNHALIAKEKIPLPKIHQEQEPEVLRRLVDAMRHFFGVSGFMPAIFTMCWRFGDRLCDRRVSSSGTRGT